MTCSTSMCLSEWRKNLGYIIYRSFELRLILFLFYLNCACVHKCVLVFNLLYTASSACVLTRSCLGKFFALELTILFNIHYHHPHHSLSLSQKFHVLLFLSARHPIDTFAIQQKKYFYYSILHLGS